VSATAPAKERPSSAPALQLAPPDPRAQTALSRGFIPTLDGLRAIAILAVLARHTNRTEAWDDAASVASRRFTGPGWVGVDLFFVISGFLITRILRDARRRPHFFRNFYVRRALRIFPPYYALLLVTLCVLPHFVAVVQQSDKDVLSRQGWLWTYTNNIDVWIHGWSRLDGWLWLEHTWSLAVEEQFYLLWPLVVLLASTRALAGIALTVVALSPIVRLLMLRAGLPAVAVYTFTAFRFDPFAMGGLLALFCESTAFRERAPRVALVLVLASLPVLLGIVIRAGGFDEKMRIVQILGYSAIGGLSAGLVLAAVIADPRGLFGRMLSSGPLSSLGRYSYAVYLFHYPLQPLLTRIFPGVRMAAATGSALFTHFVFTVFESLVAVALAYVSWHAMERHFIGLKDRFTK
jgi:peptidoglycan/LPS O-acetylase OafA/YrhL